MFTHMKHIKNVSHNAHELSYELDIYQVEETGEYRVYVSESGNAAGDIYTCSDEVVTDAKRLSGTDLVNELISIAKNDIEKNKPVVY